MTPPTYNEMNIRFYSGEFELHGTLHLPSGVMSPPIVFGSHGLLASGESPKQVALARRLNAEDIAFFRFDHRGCGKSEGSFREITSLSGRCEDLSAAVDTIFKRNVTGKNIGLFGSSMGGAVCINSYGSIKPAAMVTYAAPVRSKNINEVIKKESKKSSSAGPLYDPDSLRFDISGKLGDLNHILIIHGDGDETVPVSHAHQIYEASHIPKKLFIQKGGDHPMSDAVHQETFLQEAVAWFKQYLF